MPDYTFEPGTGIWRNRKERRDVTLGLRDVSYANGRLEYSSRNQTEPERALDDYLAVARLICAAAVERSPQPNVGLELLNNSEQERLRWFPLPGEIAAGDK